MYKIGDRITTWSGTRENPEIIPATVKEIKTDADGINLYKCVYDDVHPIWGECFDWMYSAEIEPAPAYNYDVSIIEMLTAAGYYYAADEAGEIASIEKYYSSDDLTGEPYIDREAVQDHLNRLHLGWTITGLQDPGSIYDARLQIASAEPIDF